MSRPAIKPGTESMRWPKGRVVQHIAEIDRFFVGEGPVHETMRKIANRLDSLGIPFAVAGGMALNALGHRRATDDVDILVNREGLERIHVELEGLGYVPPFAGSKNLRDSETNTRIEFLISGGFPGDGKPSPVPFPEPGVVRVEIDGVPYVSLPTFIELKIASGLTGGALRMKDFTDVIELIVKRELPREFSEQLNLYVRPKFIELWDGIASSPKSDY